MLVSIAGSLANLPVTAGIASDSFTTHVAIPLAATLSATNVEVNTTGYRKAILFIKGNGTYNCQGYVYGVMRDGLTTVQIATTIVGLNGFVTFDLDGLSKIQINVKNTDATNANTITADVFLQQ